MVALNEKDQKVADEFNNIQRAHQQTLGTIQFFIMKFIQLISF